MVRRVNAIVMRLMLLASAVSAPAARAAGEGITPQAGTETFYAARRQPMWFAGNMPVPAANALPAILRRSQLDGLSDGPVLAAQVELAIHALAANPATAPAMDRVVSQAWVRYVQALQASLPGFEYADGRRPANVDSAGAILERAARDPQGLLAHVLTVAEVNPLYGPLRDAVWNDGNGSGAAPAARATANLARIRILLPEGKAVIVDAGAAKLYMFEDGKLVDQMRVVVGKPETPTPLIASTVYYATFNPYWNVPANLVQQLVATRVSAQGVGYLKDHHYEVVTEFGPSGSPLVPASIDWKAAADGKAKVLVRQLPGPLNSMGSVKFAFANGGDVYLHDTPNKASFTQDRRLLSNGCIRLEDARRLGRWMLGREPEATSALPDNHVLLPSGIPIYVTYLTMKASRGKLDFIADAYGRDEQQGAQLAAR